MNLKLITNFPIINDIINSYIFIYTIFFGILIFQFINVLRHKKLNSISFVWIIIILELMYLSVMIGSKTEIIKGCLSIIVIFKTPYYVFILFSIFYFLVSKFLNSKENETIINSILVGLIIFGLINSTIGFWVLV